MIIKNNFHNLILLALILCSFTAQSQIQTNTLKTMNNQTIQKFYVIGISTRTTNENGQSAKDIEALWGKCWGEENQTPIPNKMSDEIYAVYTN